MTAAGIRGCRRRSTTLATTVSENRKSFLMTRAYSVFSQSAPLKVTEPPARRYDQAGKPYPGPRVSAGVNQRVRLEQYFLSTTDPAALPFEPGPQAHQSG